MCGAGQYTGYHADGGYAEYTLAPEAWAYEIPQSFDDAAAAPLLCAGLIGWRALKRAALRPGGSLAIFGFGSSAHLAIQIALHQGCTVFVVTRSAEHQAPARQMGAVWAGGEAAGIPGKVDSAVIFAPAGKLVPDALQALEKGGTLALAGIHMSDIPALRYEPHLFHEKNIGSVKANTREDGRELMALASEIPLRPETTLYSLADANEALRHLKQSRINGTGVLLMAD